MPYSANEKLPKQTASLPDDAKTIWREAFNSAFKTYKKDEGRASAVAWSAVRRAGWERDSKGNWVRKHEPVSKSPIEFKIEKADDEQRLVFGWAIPLQADDSPITDLQGDVITADELEKAAYDFVLNSRMGGEMHQGDANGQIVESFVATREKFEKMGVIDSKAGKGWWLGIKFSSEAYAKVKDGTYKQFSIQGTAVREEIKEPVNA